MTAGNVAYHLEVLKKQRLVCSIRTAREEFYFQPMAAFSTTEMRSLSVVAHPSRFRLATAIARMGPVAHGELARTVGMDKGVLSRQLRKLEHAGLVVTLEGQKRFYQPSPLLGRWLAARSVLAREAPFNMPGPKISRPSVGPRPERRSIWPEISMRTAK